MCSTFNEDEPSITPPRRNPHLDAWVRDAAAITKPDRIHWCDGSEAERQALTARAVAEGALIELDQAKWPGCHYHRSDPNDVARTADVTFICTPSPDDAGPTNNWMPPDEAYASLRSALDGAMRGRTMYVVPYVMGPLGSPHRKIGVQLTDSVYVALNLRIMTRMGQAALDALGDAPDFNRGLHSTLDLDPAKRRICHFPQDNAIMSVGSGYGGNALLPKKCFALRIASCLARREGWLAEHMLLMGVESPEGEMTYVAAAFPSACGKTNFAMMVPPKRFDGWRIWTVGDDIAWMHVGADGRLWAINPENGYFGVVPGTSERSNPNAMASIRRDSIFTNVALAPDGDVWWEGKDGPVPAALLDWRGEPWDDMRPGKAAHPNSRFTAPMRNNPCLSPLADDPRGVPISAIVFGGRRATTVPLVLQSFNWTHGVYLGATLGSETTAAATGKVGVLRRDPMAMLDFCGYHMGDYFGHWLSMQKRLPSPPKIFMVNWFRQDDRGGFLWPGFGENMRVLKWIVDRARGRTGARETAVGWVPRAGDLDLSGLHVPDERIERATAVDLEEWRREIAAQQELFDRIGGRMPRPLALQRDLLSARLDVLSA